MPTIEGASRDKENLVGKFYWVSPLFQEEEKKTIEATTTIFFFNLQYFSIVFYYCFIACQP
jgi:hypothetical protein